MLRDPSKVVDHTDIALLTERMLPIIARPTNIDPKSLTNQIMYVASRVPKEVFYQDADVQIKFNDNPEFFLNHKSIDDKPDAKTAPDRKRFYVVEEVEGKDHGPKKKVITIHAQSKTAVVETMVHISVIEQLRGYLTRLINHEIPSHDRHLFERRTKLIKKLMTLFVDDPSTAVNELDGWLKRKIEFIGNEDLPAWDDLKEKSKTSRTLAADTRRALEGGNLPRGIMFANTYSLPNILSHHLLNKRTVGGTRRKIFIEKALQAWEKYHKDSDETVPKNPLESLGESLNKIGISEVGVGDFEPKVQFKIDNLILFFITRKNGNGNGNGFHDDVTEEFLADFNSPDRLTELGVSRVVSADKSPTADPIDFIDFSLISDEIIANLNPLIKSSISKLKRSHYSALYMPYAPGDLTYSIITEMKKAIPSINDVMEVGKVAHYVGGFTRRKFSDIGHLVLPKHTFEITKPSAPNAYSNKVKLKHLEVFDDDDRIAYETALIQFPSVILQEAEDMEDYLIKIFGEKLVKQHFTINMEVASFREAITRSHGALQLFEADYISDHAISQKTIDANQNFGSDKTFKQITKKMEEEGVQGVHATTAAVFLALAQSL